MPRSVAQSLRIPPAVKTGQDSNSLSPNEVVDRIWKSPEKCAANRVIHGWELAGILLDRGKAGVNRSQKFPPQG